MIREEATGSPEPDSKAADGATPKLAEAGISQEALERATQLEGLDPHDHKALLGLDHWQDIQLKRTYAKWLLVLVAAQLFIADTVFVIYAWAGESWHLETGVVQVWLTSTLVELIGVALVIARYLFPRRDLYRPGAGE